MAPLICWPAADAVQQAVTQYAASVLGQVESRLAVRERANHPVAPPDLTQDAFKETIGPDGRQCCSDK